MFGGDALALDAVSSGRGHVEQQIDEVVFEKVNFVYVEEAAVGAREQSRLESLDALSERAREVDGSAHAVFRSAEREFDDWHAPALARDARKIPFLIVRGRLGGSAMTAAAINALAREDA